MNHMSSTIFGTKDTLFLETMDVILVVTEVSAQYIGVVLTERWCRS